MFNALFWKWNTSHDSTSKIIHILTHFFTIATTLTTAATTIANEASLILFDSFWQLPVKTSNSKTTVDNRNNICLATNNDVWQQQYRFAMDQFKQRINYLTNNTVYKFRFVKIMKKSRSWFNYYQVWIIKLIKCILNVWTSTSHVTSAMGNPVQSRHRRSKKRSKQAIIIWECL